MRSSFTQVLVALTVVGFGLTATQAMADTLHLSFQTGGVSINLNVGDDGALNPQPLPPKAKLKPSFYDNGPSKPYPHKFLQADYDDEDDVMINPQPLPPKYWKSGKSGGYGKYGKYQSYGNMGIAPRMPRKYDFNYEY